MFLLHFYLKSNVTAACSLDSSRKVPSHRGDFLLVMAAWTSPKGTVDNLSPQGQKSSGVYKTPVTSIARLLPRHHVKDARL